MSLEDIEDTFLVVHLLTSSLEAEKTDQKSVRAIFELLLLGFKLTKQVSDQTANCVLDALSSLFSQHP